ncbi:MAG: restriction endonuclease [Solobacterium sp.]|nr:restriction endonuclease [Solobacterium sp.]
MNGYEFEQYCAKLLKNKGYTNIETTRASKDQGIDIIADKGRYRYGIQCKYYDRPVGNSAVQEAAAGAKYYKCDRAAVMTNSTFTEPACSLAEINRVMLWDSIRIDPAVDHGGWLIDRISNRFSLLAVILALILTAVSFGGYFALKPALFLLAGALFNCRDMNSGSLVFLAWIFYSGALLLYVMHYGFLYTDYFFWIYTVLFLIQSVRLAGSFRRFW